MPVMCCLINSFIEGQTSSEAQQILCGVGPSRDPPVPAQRSDYSGNYGSAQSLTEEK